MPGCGFESHSTLFSMLNVNLIRVFEGHRHEKLRFLWECWAEYNQRQARLVWHANPTQKCHADCLKEIWGAEVDRPERYAVITEHDFLPAYKATTFCPRDLFSATTPVLGVHYATRDPKTMRLIRHPFPGAWFVAVDKTRFSGPINFAPGGPFNDPANLMEDDLPFPVQYLGGLDAYPEHFGIRYSVGEHLFWSRHYHDPPNRVVAGVYMGDVQRTVDKAMLTWIKNAPQKLQNIILQRIHSFGDSHDRA